MKTKEEAKKHLFENGYTRDAICRILGFLVGTGTKDINEVFKCLKGDGTFEDFYTWWNDLEVINVDEEECEQIIQEVLDEYKARFDKAENPKEKTKFAKIHAVLSEYLIEDEE